MGVFCNDCNQFFYVVKKLKETHFIVYIYINLTKLNNIVFLVHMVHDGRAISNRLFKKPFNQYMKGLVTIMEFHKVKEKIFSELKKVKM